ncbi:hypothetical protein WMY93_026590 [Mugilogobius chulae]|uniref:Pyrin domain-containing protein n=1 Tax=Mugilogobius chulae TaxID=88201 RepID=A0AAW0N1C7_9GOBI
MDTSYLYPDVRKTLTWLLQEVFSDFTSSSSLQELKWSIRISIQWIISQLHDADIHRVMELIQKSAVCLELAMGILKSQGKYVAVLAATKDSLPKSTEYTWKVFMEALRSLTRDEYNSFLSKLGDELEQIWKHKLKEADLSQVVQLLEKLFGQDLNVLLLILEDMCALKLIHVSPDTSLTERGASDAFLKMSDGEFQKLRRYLKHYFPHFSISALEDYGRREIFELIQINACRSCVELTEKVLKRIDRPDLVKKLSHLSCDCPEFTGPARNQGSRLREPATTPSLEKLFSDMDLGKTAVNRDPSVPHFWRQKYDDIRVGVLDILAEREFLLDKVSVRHYRHLEWFVQFACMEEGLSWIDLDCERQSQEFEIMASACSPLTDEETCVALLRAVVVKLGQQTESFMNRVFKDMNMFGWTFNVWPFDGDTQKLSAVWRPTSRSSASFERNQFRIVLAFGKEKEMEALINRLMNTLERLNASELMDMKQALTTGGNSTMQWYRLCHYDTSSLVFSIVQTYGLRSVKLIKNLLELIGRKDLQSKLDSGKRSGDSCSCYRDLEKNTDPAEI